MKSLIALASLIFSVGGAAVQDGIYFKFTCIKDGQVMTVDSEGVTPGANITAAPWAGTDNQKWLAFKADGGDNYLLLPRRQHKLFASFQATRNSKGPPGSNKLPGVTVVLGIDVQSGAITQQVYHGKSNQLWQFVDAKEGRVLIKSPAREKCVKEKEPVKVEYSFIQKASMKIKDVFGRKPETAPLEPVQLQANDCNAQDSSQTWRLDS